MCFRTRPKKRHPQISGMKNCACAYVLKAHIRDKSASSMIVGHIIEDLNTLLEAVYSTFEWGRREIKWWDYLVNNGFCSIFR